MPRVLIVNQNPSQIPRATRVLTSSHVTDIVCIKTVAAALEHLEDVTEGTQSAPDLMIVDLEFPLGSGFDILRAWKNDSDFHPIKIIVWAASEEPHAELCRLFGLKHVLSDFASDHELHAAVKDCLSRQQTKNARAAGSI